MKNYRNNYFDNHSIMVFLSVLAFVTIMFNIDVKASTKKRWEIGEDIILNKTKIEKESNKNVRVWEDASREIKKTLNVDRSYEACAKRFERNINCNNLLRHHNGWNNEKDQELSNYVENHGCEFDIDGLVELGNEFNENPMFLVERSRRYCGLDTRVMFNGSNIYGNNNDDNMVNMNVENTHKFPPISEFDRFYNLQGGLPSFYPNFPDFSQTNNF